MTTLLMEPELTPKLAAWCAQHIPHVAEGAFGPCYAIGIASGPVDDPQALLYAVVVYHDHQVRARTMQVSIAARSPRWCTRGTLQALFHVPFEQMNVHKLWSAMPHDNKRAIKLNTGLGFKYEAQLRHQFGRNRHAVIQSMIYPEYLASRWAVLQLRKDAA